VVFRVGSHFLSVKAADRRSNLLLLQEHSPRDYARIELQLGATIPDFAFRDPAGTPRRLHDLRSKYTLLFFWGVGCGAWDRYVPTLNEALARFGGAGLSLLAISDASGDAAIRSRVAETGARWIQVAARDGKELYSKRFRVFQSPTLILIDGERRIVSRDQPGEMPLRDAGLLSTLSGLLGEPTGGKGAQ